MRIDNNVLERIACVIIIAILSVQLLIFSALPLIQEQNDSASYYMNVYYALTGKYIVEDIYPSFTLPSQAYPFLGYSLPLFAGKVLSNITDINWATIVKYFHFIFYALTCLVFIRISKRVFKSKLTAYLTGIIYLLYYPHFNFAKLVMSETYAILILASCILLFIKFVQHNKNTTAVMMYLLSGHLVLIKPVCILIVMFFLTYHILALIKSNHSRISALAILTLLVFPAFQMLYSLNNFGNTHIRTGFGRNLWNRVIAHDRLIPQHSATLNKVDSIFKSHNENIPWNNWWNITMRLSSFGYTEKETSDICYNIAKDGLKENKFRYIVNSFANSNFNYNYGPVNGFMYCSPVEYKSAIEKFDYDKNHSPLVNELLKQSFTENGYSNLMQKINCKLADLSSGFYFIIHNQIVIVLFLISGILIMLKTVKRQPDPQNIIHLLFWWTAFAIVFGSNLTEYPQSRLMLPAVMYVILTVIHLTNNAKIKKVKKSN